MEFETKIIPSEEIGDFLHFIREENRLISQILGFKHSNPYEEDNYVDAYFKGNYIPMTTLPQEISPTREILLRLLHVGYILLEQESYLEKLINRIVAQRNIKTKGPSYMRGYDELILAASEIECEIFPIVAFRNNIPYGGIFAFWNKRYPDQITIQGITKYIIPTLI